MFFNKKQLYLRNASGASLIEALCVMFIMGFVAATCCEVFALMNLSYFRSNSAVNINLNARRALTVIGSNIRQTKTFLPVLTIPAVQSSRAVWPSTLTQDSRTIITQDYDNEITVFKILPDKQLPGKGSYVLEKLEIKPASNLPIIQASTLSTNIVGPIDPSDTQDSTSGTPIPKCFTGLQKMVGKVPDLDVSLQNGTQNKFPEFELPGFQAVEGIGVRLELLDTENANPKMTPSSIAIKAEFFKRIPN